MDDVAAAALASAGGSLLVAVPGLALLWLLRRRALTVLVPTVGGLAALSGAAGLLAASLRMEGRADHLDVWLPASLVSVGVALVGGLWLAQWVRRSGDELAELVRRAGSPDQLTVDGPAELRAIGDDLVAAAVALTGSRARADALEDSRRELVSWVSHDLRTPLAGLRAMAEALEDGVVTDAPTVARYHATMRAEVDRLSALVDDLFELSRLHAGTARAPVERALLGDVVSDALASADPLARDRRVQLAARASEGLPAVQVAADDIGRVLRNLLVNAIRHTPSDGTVRIDTHADRDLIRIQVLDACGGIPEQDLPRVFDTAFRGSAARTPDESGGAGLGLAIARGLARAHRGDISVANTAGGCRFEIRLPVEAA